MSTPVKGFVYFAKCIAYDGRYLNVVKIGCADKPEQRVKSVAINLPFTCELVCTAPGGVFMEYFVHMWLRSDKIAGEFFHDRGEVTRIMDHVKKHGEHPFPMLRETQESMLFRSIDLVQFMDRHGITVRDLTRSAGVTVQGYDSLLKKERCGNRRLLAAVAVTAIKRGIKVTYPCDFIAAPAIARAA